VNIVITCLPFRLVVYLVSVVALSTISISAAHFGHGVEVRKLLKADHPAHRLQAVL